MALALRGHHAVCIFGFRGLGYSPEFAANMAHVVEAIRDPQPGVEIELVVQSDSICAACPHVDGPRCSRDPDADARVGSHDRRVLERLGLAPGTRLSPDRLVARVAGRVAPQDLPHLCSGCPWLPLGYCQEGLARQRAARGVA